MSNRLGASKRFLVTGGCGFIGSNLAITLKKSGAEVIAVDSFLTGNADNLLGTGIPYFLLDATEASAWKKAEFLAGPWDAIFHHGDITDPRFGNDAEVFQKNVSGFSHVLALAKKNRCRLVFASTAGLYGNGTVPMQEDQQKDLLTAYGRSKLEMEQLGMQASSKSRLWLALL